MSQTASTVTVVLCPHCKCNQRGTVGKENTCINSKCGKTFTPETEVPVIVYNEDGSVKE